MDSRRHLVAIPAYNEEDTIVGVATQVIECASEADVVVFDDASTDNTRSLCQQAGIRIITSNSNQGYSATLNVAYYFALQHDYGTLTYIDADGEHNPTLVQKFVQQIEDCDFVLGKRTRMNRFAEKIVGVTFLKIFGIYDPYCGMKTYNLRSLTEKRLNTQPGELIGLGLIAKALSERSQVKFRQIEVNGAERSDTSRFSRSVIRSNCILFYNALCFIYKVYVYKFNQI